MADSENSSELKARLSTLSPAKRAWLEQRLGGAPKRKPFRKGPATVVELQAGSDEPPVYFIYAGPGEIELAQTMGVGRSVFGIEMPWPLSWRDAALKNKIDALPTMEELVAPFVAALSAHVGTSSCVLAGHSFGGVIAFEAAHQLQRLGGRVEMVILLDTHGKRPALTNEVWPKLRQGWELTLDKVRAERSSNSFAVSLRRVWLMFLLISEKAIKRIFRFDRRPLSKLGMNTPFTDEQGKPLPLQSVERLYGNAKEYYDFRRLDSRGVLFRVVQDDENLGVYDKSLGWEGLFTKGLEIISVTGDHHTMIWEKSHRLTLVGKMTEVLGRIPRTTNFNASTPL
jgi:thioesterase domain-containing protein